jgi:hypothetical protein
LAWSIDPERFLRSFTGALGMLTGGTVNATPTKSVSVDIFSLLARNIYIKLKDLDYIVFTGFVVYLFAEFNYLKNNIKNDRLGVYKRLILVVFMAPFLMFIILPVRTMQHHMLPFFVIISVLAIQGVAMFMERYSGRRFLKKLAIAIIVIVLVMDISISGEAMLSKRFYTIKSHKEDIAFESGKWFRENIPVDAKIVFGYYSSIYLPSEYKNVKLIPISICGDKSRGAAVIRDIVLSYKPRYLYYSVGNSDCAFKIPAAEEFLDVGKLKVVKVFDNSGMDYQRKPNRRFVLYSIDE